METRVLSKPKLAFAGLGWIGRSRLQSAVESGLAEITFIYDPSEECLVEALKITPSSCVTSSLEALLENDIIDGVVIATPSALHMQQSVAALQNKKAVFCQKPLGRNHHEVLAVVNAAKENNKLLGADFSYRYTTAFKKIHAIIQSGELGKIFAADLKFHNAHGPGKPWFYDLSLAGGGCALDLGIHLIDLLLYGLNFPQVKKISSSLFAKGVSVKDKNEVEDYAQVFIELETDVTAQLACSWNLSAGCDAVIEVSFYGTNGSVAIKNIAGSFYNFEALRYWGTKTEVIASPPDNWGGKALIDWIKKLSVNHDFNEEAKQYLHSAEVLDMIYGRKL